jgi:CO dehydrogenase maturation factor
VQRGLKLAITGKGGVGKSTLAAALARLLAGQGRRVLAVDADPVANLATALGVPASEQARIVPIAQRKALIEERTGAKVKQYGQMFKLNPDVADVARTCAYRHEGVWGCVDLLVLGAVQQGGGGCACPESVLLRALMQDLVLARNDAVIMDMEAGIEHLGRATARGVDVVLVVVEPGRRAVDCALRIFGMCEQLGLRDVRVVGNKIVSPADEAFVREAVAPRKVVACIPAREEIRTADRSGRGVWESCPGDLRGIFEAILSDLEGEPCGFEEPVTKIGVT